MSFDRAKVLAEGGVYHGADNPLIECVSFIADKVSYASVAETGVAPSTIKESADLPKRMIIEGTFQRFMPRGAADPNAYRNANKRIYTMERVGDRVLDPNGEVMRRIAENAMIGHLEHPENGATDLNKGAIRILKVWAESDGTIKGRALVYNTPEGQRIQEYVVTRTRIGISSRGMGTVDAAGYVCEDYCLETWDIVYNPSTTGAFPTQATESAKTATEQPVQEHVSHQTVESRPSSVIIPPQDNSMSLSKRISEARSEVSRLLAVDPRKLTAEAREKYLSDVIDTRLRIAEEFVGEKRIDDIVKILERLDAAKKAYEDAAVSGWRDEPTGLVTTSKATASPADAAVTGQVDTGVPGAFDQLGQMLGIKITHPSTDADKEKGWADTKAAIALLASYYGKGGDMAKAKSALESILAGTMPTVESIETQKSLLREARNELILMTEREKAASGIIDEMRKQLTSLNGKVAEAQANEARVAAIVADLTSVERANQDKVQESTTTPATKPAPKSLAERLAERAKRTQTEGLPDGAPVASRPDASVTESQQAAGGLLNEREDKLLRVLGGSAIPKLMKS